MIAWDNVITLTLLITYFFFYAMVFCTFGSAAARKSQIAASRPEDLLRDRDEGGQWDAPSVPREVVLARQRARSYGKPYRYRCRYHRLTIKRPESVTTNANVLAHAFPHLASDNPVRVMIEIGVHALIRISIFRSRFMLILTTPVRRIHDQLTETIFTKDIGIQKRI